jgi:hypothetical protein
MSVVMITTLMSDENISRGAGRFWEQADIRWGCPRLARRESRSVHSIR